MLTSSLITAQAAPAMDGVERPGLEFVPLLIVLALGLLFVLYLVLAKRKLKPPPTRPDQSSRKR